ncbi:hypothetical protein SAMN05920897_101305 [Alkalispirochaeta americana]|uniref:Curli production assembly/transport component CsgG n=1 Tax=Alkalispirochaeta americana TaxID=159291 RepID=A0A1N6NKZ5_9SPIO|nr:hypothetical protein [Alkalispirochaeta americana]SIP92667.1 hypothetical protein SAMN05920897_101305 [Alkalispirochaeta americana]
MIKCGSKRSFLALAVSVLFFASCMTAGNREYRAAERDYDAGNYVGAVENAVKALQANDEHEDAPGLLRRALPKATSQIQEQISQAKASSEEFPYEKAVALYEQVVKLHSDVNDLRLGFSTEDYSAELEEARQTAAEARYQAGDAALAQGGFQNARVALDHFRTVGNYVEGYKDTADRIAQAESASLARLYVYVNDAEGEIAQGLGTRLMSDNNLARVTDLVPAGSLGVGTRQNASSVLAAARAQGIDLLLYVGIDTLTPDSKADARGLEIMGANAVELDISYSVTAEGRWQVYDVASGTVRNEDSLRVRTGESLKLQYLRPTGETEVGFDDGGRNAAYTQLETNLIQFVRFITRATNFVDALNVSAFENMSLTQMGEALDKVVLFPGVYAFSIEDGARPNAGMSFAEARERSSKMQSVVDAVTRRAEGMDETVLEAMRGMAGRIEVAAARETLGPLSQ